MSYEPTTWTNDNEVTSSLLNHLESGVTAVGYTPTQWSAGDVVTAEKLNKLEQGVAESADMMGEYFSRSITEFKIPEDPSGYGFDIGDGCSMSFAGCTLLEHIEGLENVQDVYENAFASTLKLAETLDFPNVEYVGKTGVTTSIGANSKISTLSFPKAVALRGSACSGMSELERVYIPSVTSLDGSLQGCSKLKHVYIGADCTSINSSCFGGSGGSGTGVGLVIDCGFAQGAVTGAPWAASSATINYNVPDPGSIDAMIEGDA